MLMKHADRTIDTSGLNCPLPILRAKQILSTMGHGQVLQIIATDPDAKRDFEAYSRKTGHLLLDMTEADRHLIIWLRKR